MPVRLYLLGLGAFTIGTTAYVITSLLPTISAQLDVSTSAAGQLSTVFALSYAVAAPLVATVTGRWNRRTLLVVALLVAAVGNLLAAVAPTFGLLLVARALTAIGAAAFTPTATLVATGLAPENRRGQAIAIVFGGLTVALAVGVPAANVLGPILGFRGVLALIAGLGVLIALAAWRTLPSVAAPAGVPLRDRLAVAADARALTVLAMSIVGVVAAMATYIYVVPLLGATAGVTGTAVTVLLVLYGVGAMVGNNLGGRTSDRLGTRRVLIAILIGFTVLAFSLPVTAGTVVGAGIALFTWGLFGWSFNPPIQSLLVEIGRERAGLLISLNASAIYLGAGIGGALGGAVINWSGPLLLPLVSGALGVVGLVLGLTLVLRRAPKRLDADPSGEQESGKQESAKQESGNQTSGDQERVVSRAT